MEPMEPAVEQTPAPEQEPAERADGQRPVGVVLSVPVDSPALPAEERVAPAQRLARSPTATAAYLPGAESACLPGPGRWLETGTAVAGSW